MNFYSKLKRFIDKSRNTPARVEDIYQYLRTEKIGYDLKDPKVITGRLLATLNNTKKEIKSLEEVEFQVFSQWGDDGIIQYLISNLQIENKTFIEFGVENYTESNTRFLVINNNWTGYIIDGSEKNIQYIKNDPISWAHELFAKAQFITKENINSLLSEFLERGYSNEIGLLSIDIDGNDYWVWKEISVINPIIVIVEYNSVFGSDKFWTIPYSANYYRLSEDNTILYFGASLGAFCNLAEEKGYYFVGCNIAGNNAYFIRKDKIGSFTPLTCNEGFVSSKFREMQLENGERVSGEERIKYLKGRKVINTKTNELELI